MFIVVDFFFFIVEFIGRVWAWENNWLYIFATPIVIPYPTLTLAPIPNLCIFATPIVIPRLLCLLVEFGCGKTIGFVFLQRQLLSHAQTLPLSTIHNPKLKTHILFGCVCEGYSVFIFFAFLLFYIVFNNV